jgi:predicted membrane-bound spermidine synthase
MRRLLYLAFFLSGVAGLIYESIWSRYLGLFVGHTAYAQVIVLVIFLGGLSLGAILVGQRSEKTRRPLFWYAAAEALVGLFGLFFHDLFLLVQEAAYSFLFPALSGSLFLGPLKWGLVAGLILPPSILLGTTFPFMSAGFLRMFSDRPGRVLSLLYFANSFGAAVGSLLAGFLLVARYGLPGTVLVAAVLNISVALVAWGVEKRGGRGSQPVASSVPDPIPSGTPRGSEARWYDTVDRQFLWRLLLGISFGTAVASFAYEIAWIRMLSLVLGTATHSFELMLSAFILGLALGSFWMRGRADHIADPIMALGWIQWIMGAAALATLPLYVASFGWTVDLLSAVNRTPSGYTLFNLARYGIALMVMLPATFCAGTTLPLITRTLLSRGEGERAIGWVYGVNTLGSIIAVGLASLLLLPLIGLKPLLVLGGGMDMALGVLLLTLATRGADARAVRPEGSDTPADGLAGSLGLRRRWTGPMAAVGASVVVLVALLGVRMDRALLSSGVYRTGRLASPDTEILFYEDGRTATVTADRKPPGVLALATNGKPDATLTELWLNPPGETPIPLSLDEPTQTLTSLIALAHNPGARNAVVVGQGSGLSSQMVLGSPNLESLVTVEIEPQMLNGSRVFLPATERVFEDPRSRFVIDDAKSFLAQGGEPLDLILSEPSNPWVSGVSSLFSVEFYARVRDRLAPGGVFGQWLHLYEISDALVLSVLAALHQTFPSYNVFLVHSADMFVVAGTEPELPAPDWSVFDFPLVAQDLARTFPFTPELLEISRFMTREGLSPLLDDWPYANSDFFPILDLGAERTRFLREPAAGILESASGPFDVADAFLPEGPPPAGTLLTPVPQIPMGRALALRNRIRAVLDRSGTPDEPGRAASEDSLARPDPENDLELRQALYRSQVASALLSLEETPADWTAWLREVLEAGGWSSATGWRFLDPTFLPEVAQAGSRLGAPAGVLAAVSFLQALEDRDWPSLVPASQALAEEIVRGSRWINPGVVLDAGVIARIFGGDPAGAWEFFGALEPLSGRSPQDFRSRLLRAHLDRAVSGR